MSEDALMLEAAPPGGTGTEEARGMRSLYAGVFLISAATLLLELALSRIFDVILYNNLAYAIVSSAIFGFGLGGVAVMLRPMPRVATRTLLAGAAAGFAVLVLFLFPAIKLTPANFEDVFVHPGRQLLAFGALYLFLLAPFFASGLTVSLLLTRHSEQVHRLYFWDLVGAGVGCVGIFVLPSLIGGEETLLMVAAAGSLAVALFAAAGSLARRAGLLSALVLAALAVGLADRVELDSLMAKRDLRLGAPGQAVEFSHWDPVSRIDVVPQDVPWRKRIAYDGGAQSSAFRQFDGDLAALRAHYFDTDRGQPRYNSGKYVALAHWLKREGAPRTLVIGSAGGQEALAALAWGAAHVDAVEMVCTVIRAATGAYANFIGHIFTHPRVTARCDEGRNFLRQTAGRYDVIQIHSNHTTSGLANGSGGAMPVYLQTVEAYKDYFSHLSGDGILQVNYFAYPRLITTAAQAWAELFPGEEFKRHLVIADGFGMMKTFLVKRSAWMPEEIAEVRSFLGPAFPDPRGYKLIYAPGQPEEANVPPEFFAVPLDPRLAEAVPYKVSPPTDDRPFFRDLRREARPLQADMRGYVPEDTAEFLNGSLRNSVPMEAVHLYLLGWVSVAVASVVVLVPLLWLRRRGARLPGAGPALVYFACLGAGFIIVELALMSKLVLLAGHPIYAMATVLFTLLVSAGCGSFLSGRLPDSQGRWAVVAILVFALAAMTLVAIFPLLRDLTLGTGQAARLLLVAAFLVPIGVPLGMPFPLGIAALRERAPGLIPWAWGVNGFMTVVGSLLAVVLSIKFGFNVALLAAVAIYLVAVPSYLALRRVRPADPRSND